MNNNETAAPQDGETSPFRPQERRENTIGILRLDIGKPRRNSGSSVEFRMTSDGKIDTQCDIEPASPQPSAEKLPVTFTTEEQSVYSDSSVKVNFFTPEDSSPMDKVRFSRDQTITDGEEEEEDYSASVSAILHRRASQRHQSSKKRRPSSPLFSPDVDNTTFGPRRRSSAFTTSSGDTAISVDDGTTQEQIFLNIKLHKEVLSSVKQQAWNMRRKVRLVQQAKAYVKRHEGELQERLAQSKSTRDILARFNIVIIKHWQYLKRELANLMNNLIPWELRIKEIESHFGSVVASYFTFLRWLFWVNLAISVVLIAFVTVPEMLIGDRKEPGERKELLPDERKTATNLFTLWDFDGVLKYSPLFYGYYSDQYEKHPKIENTYSYHLPLAYFMTELAVYVYSFVAILRKMAENSRQSKLSEKDEECIFTWKLFTGWDYMIGNAETAHNRTASIILGFKEALLEEAERKRDEGRNWKITSLRVFANINMVWLLGASVYAVMWVVDRSTQPDANIGWWRQNELTVVLSLITSVFPVLFEVLGALEGYHPRKKLRMQLGRIMALNLLNLYSFIIATFSKINNMSLELQSLKVNLTLSQTCTRSDTTFSTPTMGEKYKTISYSEFNPTTMPTPVTKCYPVTCSTQVPNISTITTIVSLLLSSTSLTTNILSSSSEASSQLFTSPSSTILQPLNETESSNWYTDDTMSTPNNTLYSSDQTFSIIDMLKTFKPNDTIYFNETTDSSYNVEDFTFNTTQDNFTQTPLLFDTTEMDNYNYSQIEDFIKQMFLSTEDTTMSKYLDKLFKSTTSSPENLLENSNKITLSNADLQTLYSRVLEEFTQFRPEHTTQTPCYECIPVDETHTSTLTSLSTNWFSYADNGSISSTPLPTGTFAPDDPLTEPTTNTSCLDEKTRKKLRGLCWETMFGRDLIKITVMDLVVTVASTITTDFFRAVFVRVMNNCWCWDLEKKFPQYGDFKIAENILHLVNNQGFVWMGMFFSPGLPLINSIKLIVMMYIRSWAVLTCNVPHEVVFRASRSNNFYLALLLTMLFLCVLPVGYAIVWVTPSWHCGPFSNYRRIYFIFTKSLKKALPKSFHKSLDYIASPGIVIPLLMLLVLIIYYLISLTNALREANNDLKIQLRRERTEERRKMFQLVDRRRHGGNDVDAFSKWRKILPSIPTNKSTLPDTRTGNSNTNKSLNGSAKPEAIRNKEHFSRLAKKARKKSSCTSEDNGMHMIDGDGTDAEQHESLPDDNKYDKKSKKEKSFHSIVAAVHRKSTNSEKDKLTKTKEKAKDKKQIREKSPSIISTTSTYREREDSVASGWSDNIPKIRISQTDDSLEEHEYGKPETGSTDTIINNDVGKNEQEIGNNKTISNKANKTHIHQNTKSITKPKNISDEYVGNSDKQKSKNNEFNSEPKNETNIVKFEQTHKSKDSKIGDSNNDDEVFTKPDIIDNEPIKFSSEHKNSKTRDNIDNGKKRRKLLVKLKNAIDDNVSESQSTEENRCLENVKSYNVKASNDDTEVSSDSDVNKKESQKILPQRKGNHDNNQTSGDAKVSRRIRAEDKINHTKRKIEINNPEKVDECNGKQNKDSTENININDGGNHIEKHKNKQDNGNKASENKYSKADGKQIRQFKEVKNIHANKVLKKNNAHVYNKNEMKHKEEQLKGKEENDDVSEKSEIKHVGAKPKTSFKNSSNKNNENSERTDSEDDAEIQSESEESDESPPTMVTKVDSTETKSQTASITGSETENSDQTQEVNSNEATTESKSQTRKKIALTKALLSKTRKKKADGD